MGACGTRARRIVLVILANLTQHRLLFNKINGFVASVSLSLSRRDLFSQACRYTVQCSGSLFLCWFHYVTPLSSVSFQRERASRAALAFLCALFRVSDVLLSPLPSEIFIVYQMFYCRYMYISLL